MIRSRDPFERQLLRRAFLGISSVLVLVLALALVLQLTSGPYQPAYLPVSWLRAAELLVVAGGLVWALLDRQVPSWVAPSVLAANGALALIIVSGSGGHRLLSMTTYLVDGAQILLAVGVFLRSPWATALAGLVLGAGALVLFAVLPSETFSWVLPPAALDLGFLILMVAGLVMFTAFIAFNSHISIVVTRRAQEAAEALRAIAFQDAATGLPNGLQLEADMTAWEAGTPYPLVLVGFRLDGLEELNEIQGVEATSRKAAEVVKAYAAELLAEVAPKLRYERPAPFRGLYRFESNLFVYAVRSSPEVSEVLAHHQTLAKVIQRLTLGNPGEGRLSFQGGYTYYPEDAEGARQLLRNLLNMLHSRRPDYHGRFVPFNRALYLEHLRREELQAALGRAIDHGAFRLVYQPKVKIATGRTAGFEALARWDLPSAGSVSPAEFIPLAEESGHIAHLTRVLVNQSFQFLRDLETQGFGQTSVAVNLSPGVFNPEFLDEIVTQLQVNGLGPRWQIEITEGVLMRLSGALHDRFVRLKALGVTFSIDDFGTGYSNLGYLQHLEADVLKIDKRFIDGIPADEKNGKLVRAIVQMAHSLGMGVVAEGVEYQEQRDFLAGLGCDEIQGYLYSKPLEAAAVVPYLQGDLDA